MSFGTGNELTHRGMRTIQVDDSSDLQVDLPDQINPSNEYAHKESPEDRETARQMLDRQCLYVSVARRNPGKSLLCEPQKVRCPSRL